MAKPVRVALLGAGARGELNLATLARRHPDALDFVAVAESDPERRASFAARFGISPQGVFDSAEELFSRPRLADAVVNALPCRLHFRTTKMALEAGYHVFLEKPVALKPEECVCLLGLAERHERLVHVALQSRYNDIYSRMRALADSRIGRTMTIDCAENIGYWHFALSYVRGIHRNEGHSHSFVLAKGVHDLDLVSWFAGAPARRVSSFGSLSFFRPENAPEGAPRRCIDGCPVERDCPFSALKQFVDPGRPDLPPELLTGMSLRAVWDVLREPRFRTLASVIVHDVRKENRVRAIREESHGYCVFRADNDVVDHQTVSVEFENGVVASFSLNGFSLLWERTLSLHGTEGELLSKDFSGRLELRTYQPGRVRRERIRYHGIIHGGGDEAILLAFAEALRRGTPPGQVLTSLQNTLESHLLCFAAEASRRGGHVVDMATFRATVWEEAAALL